MLLQARKRALLDLGLALVALFVPTAMTLVVEEQAMVVVVAMEVVAVAAMAEPLSLQDGQTLI